jgi:type IV pilus assembly protein PilN
VIEAKGTDKGLPYSFSLNVTLTTPASAQDANGAPIATDPANPAAVVTPAPATTAPLTTPAPAPTPAAATAPGGKP